MPRTRNPKPGTKRRRKHYSAAKSTLIEQLGGACETCGTSGTKTNPLTFDHLNGRDWDISAVHATKRLRLYAEEAAAGKLQILCRSCNSSKGRPPDPTATATTDDQPFLPPTEGTDEGELF